MVCLGTWSALLACTPAVLTAAVPVNSPASSYVPTNTTCPRTQLVRRANGVSPAEAHYIARRYHKASLALESWLKKIDPGFEAGRGKWGDEERRPHGRPRDCSKAPVIALTSSGGGYRAQLTGGGVVRGFDGRESARTAVSGLYQALTYHAGLSGGSWLLSSIAGNDYPTISSLQSHLWEPTLQDSVIVPQILLSEQAKPIYNAVLADVQAKIAAGYTPSIIDPWGRLLSYGLLYGRDGGVQDSMSGIASGSSFVQHHAPYPIITALGSDRNISGVCIPQTNATQYEFHPYEFGSWDHGVDAFVSSQYLGTSFTAGRPTGHCVTHYDQLGYVLGTSSNVFASACSALPANESVAASSTALAENLAYLTAPGAPAVPESALFAQFPNPFHAYAPSAHVASQTSLELVDGGVGVGYQGNPIWPFLHRADVDVVLVNDNSADSTANFPNGTEIQHTYQAAVAAGLHRMPAIPAAEVFVARGFDKNPTFFGCHDADKLTLIFIPNVNYTYPSGQPTTKIQYATNETRGMVANGVRVANYGGKANWPRCLACGIMKKTGEKLPRACAACFAEYCYN